MELAAALSFVLWPFIHRATASSETFGVRDHPTRSSVTQAMHSFAHLGRAPLLRAPEDLTLG
jgi:hypothetical protein